MKKKLYKTSEEDLTGTLMCRGLFGGDHLETMTMKYKKMIFKIALKIINYDKRKELDDLVQTGFLALYAALDKYKDIKNGAKLSTYIYIYIHGMMRSMQSSDIPNSLSLDTPLDGEDSGSEYEHIRDNKKDPLSKAITREILNACDKLPELSSKVIQLRYMDGKTLQEVGEECGFSRQRAEQIEKSALKKIKETLGLTEVKNAAF